MMFSLVALALLCLLSTPSQAGRKPCVMYTTASTGTLAPFIEEQWLKTHRYFNITTEKDIIRRGRQCLGFMKEWYGIDLEVHDDILLRKVASPVPVKTKAFNGTFRVSTSNPSINHRLYSELRYGEIRQYYVLLAINSWSVTTYNEFVVTEGRNQGMVVPANSAIGCHDIAFDIGKEGIDPIVLLRHENRVPSRGLPMAKGSGRYVMFNSHVTSPSHPQFGEGVSRGVIPIEADGTIDGRMVVAFPCK